MNFQTIGRYRQKCDEQKLKGKPGHPGWEVTTLRVKKTLHKLGLLDPTNTPVHPNGKHTILGMGNGGAQRVEKQSVRGQLSADIPTHSSDADSIILVTHGAVTHVAFELLTGGPPVTVANVGSFYLLEWNDQTLMWEQQGRKGEANMAHIAEKGNNAL